jgi:hypothetical protein
MTLVIHCADIGSVRRGNFGWARLEVVAGDSMCTTGCEIEAFADAIAADINAGYGVALGFECPLFVPVPADPENLTLARPGEGNRSWSAGAGAASLATGLTETVWILNRVRRQLRAPCAVHGQWKPFQLRGACLSGRHSLQQKPKPTHIMAMQNWLFGAFKRACPIPRGRTQSSAPDL